MKTADVWYTKLQLLVMATGSRKTFIDFFEEIQADALEAAAEKIEEFRDVHFDLIEMNKGNPINPTLRAKGQVLNTAGMRIRALKPEAK